MVGVSRRCRLGTSDLYAGQPELLDYSGELFRAPSSGYRVSEFGFSVLKYVSFYFSYGLFYLSTAFIKALDDP